MGKLTGKLLNNFESPGILSVLKSEQANPSQNLKISTFQFDT